MNSAECRVHCDQFKDGSVCMRSADHYGDCQSLRERLAEVQGQYLLWTLR